MVSYAIASLGVVGISLYLLRRWRSSKWGRCSSTRMLNGEVIIITGGNAGLGAETAKDLAKRGATLILACRSFNNTKDVLEEIRVKSGNNDVHYMHLDLASLDSVKQFTTDLVSKYPKIYALVCNAGVWIPMENHAKTSDDFEIHAGVNHLGHFLLTNILLEKLVQPYPRIVMVSSALQSSGRLDFATYDHFKEGRQPEPGSKAFAPTGYCDSKQMNVLFAKEITNRMPNKGIFALSVCPGWCYTQLSRHVHISFLKKILFLPIMFLFMRSAARGAQNIIQAVVEDEDKLVNGGFYRECKLADENTGLDAKSQIGKELWRLSEELTK